MNITEVFKKEIGTKFKFDNVIWELCENELTNKKELRSIVTGELLDDIYTLEYACSEDFKVYNSYELYTLKELIEMEKNVPYNILISLEEIDKKNCKTAYTIKEALMQLSTEYNAIDFYNIINSKSFIKL